MEDHVEYQTAHTFQPSVFLSEEDLIYLTGYSLPSKQREHLERLRIPHYMDRAGHPRVLRSHLEQPSATTPVPEVNLNKLHAMLGR